MSMEETLVMQELQKQSFSSSPRKLTLRQRTLLTIAIAVAILLAVVIGAMHLGEAGLHTNFLAQNQAPSLHHPLGTDWLGRDMLTRTLCGLNTSVFVGLIAASCSAVIAVLLGAMAATMGGMVDTAISWLVDLFLGVPHIVALILVAFAMGGGTQGVITAVAITHWPRLARIVRAEVLQLRETEFVQAARGLGKSKWYIMLHHMIPHAIPQFLVGLVLLIPHAILHEAGLTFLGFGLSPHQPAIGVILAESMRQLSTGRWWLALLPGLTLLIVVRVFDVLGDNTRALIDPRSIND